MFMTSFVRGRLVDFLLLSLACSKEERKEGRPIDLALAQFPLLSFTHSLTHLFILLLSFRGGKDLEGDDRESNFLLFFS